MSAIITARRENETSSYDAKTPTSDRVCLPRLLQRCGGKMQHHRSTFATEERGRLQTKRLEPLDNKNKKSERRRPTGRIVQHILRPPCAQFIRLQNYIVVKCTVFCDGMNCNAFVTNSTCRKRADKNGKCLASGKCSVENATAAMPWPNAQWKMPPGSRTQRCEIINCKQATFHQTRKTCKNCTTPSFSSRLSQENKSPWQPEHFVIDHLCSRAASKQP